MCAWCGVCVYDLFRGVSLVGVYCCGGIGYSCTSSLLGIHVHVFVLHVCMNGLGLLLQYHSAPCVFNSLSVVLTRHVLHRSIW